MPLELFCLACVVTCCVCLFGGWSCTVVVRPLSFHLATAGCTVEQMGDLQTFVENEFMEWLHAQGHSTDLHNWVKNLKKRK